MTGGVGCGVGVCAAVNEVNAGQRANHATPMATGAQRARGEDADDMWKEYRKSVQ